MNEIIKRNTTKATIPGDDPSSNTLTAFHSETSSVNCLNFQKATGSPGRKTRRSRTVARFIVNVDELLIGWQRWEDDQPVDQVMGRVIDRFQKPSRRRRSAVWTAKNGSWTPRQATRTVAARRLYPVQRRTRWRTVHVLYLSSKGGLDAIAVFLEGGMLAADRPS